jgi:hypothetical protein
MTRDKQLSGVVMFVPGPRVSFCGEGRKFLSDLQPHGSFDRVPDILGADIRARRLHAPTWPSHSVIGGAIMLHFLNMCSSLYYMQFSL